ncbi:MAG TPA: glycosyltransferase family 39 protein, partial [Anaerolineae bacterium]|nr:glycosyltransferase family 39 protein [Anaerolineae bacterium]
VLGGDHPLYFAANNGREPFFIYLVTLSVGLFGRTVLALRLPAALIGTLTIPATYWLGRELFTRRIGLLAAAIMTVTLWPVHLSHIGLRAVSLPLFSALWIALGLRAYRSNRRRDWIIAGVVYGASFYTYLASRFTPFALILFSIGLLISRRSHRVWPNVIFFAAAAAVVVTPLAITAVNQWDVVMGRPGDISIFNSNINHGDLIGTAANSTLKAMGMFFWQGDSIPRHNVPDRPVFDPILSIAFVIGLMGLIAALLPHSARGQKNFFSAFSAMNKLASIFVLVWMAVMLLPTILAEDSPHFLRAVGVLPIAMLIPAIGLDLVGQWITRRATPANRVTPGGPLPEGDGDRQSANPMAARSRLIRSSFFSAVIILAGVFTLRDYSQYVIDPRTGYDFEVAGTELAKVGQDAAAAHKQVFIADRFLRDWAS